ncbi:hypothetical protein BPOR_0314g00120 [Botrytis porri]|uniref:Uncharacterized protein n=1 Tax=Botrytis porri TaxID=87229 RepID=A0A4Z1KJT1_9HELO|nr:hypothetical protein BPOR_0314g00120 [Botrytis porri]
MSLSGRTTRMSYYEYTFRRIEVSRMSESSNNARARGLVIRFGVDLTAASACLMAISAPRPRHRRSNIFIVISSPVLGSLKTESGSRRGGRGANDEDGAAGTALDVVIGFERPGEASRAAKSDEKIEAEVGGSGPAVDTENSLGASEVPRSSELSGILAKPRESCTGVYRLLG